jgi:hypothetical protein
MQEVKGRFFLLYLYLLLELWVDRNGAMQLDIADLQ